MKCPYCKQDVSPVLKERPDTPHSGEYRCSICNTHIKWKPKEKNINKRLANKIKPQRCYCQMCLRHNSRFGIGEILEIHYILEIQYGGLDIKDNTLTLCKRCHNLTHYLRDLCKK